MLPEAPELPSARPQTPRAARPPASRRGFTLTVRGVVQATTLLPVTVGAASKRSTERVRSNTVARRHARMVQRHGLELVVENRRAGGPRCRIRGIVQIVGEHVDDPVLPQREHLRAAVGVLDHIDVLTVDRLALFLVERDIAQVLDGQTAGVRRRNGNEREIQCRVGDEEPLRRKSHHTFFTRRGRSGLETEDGIALRRISGTFQHVAVVRRMPGPTRMPVP